MIEKVRVFQLPRGSEFSLPEDWWIAAGMDAFHRTGSSYRSDAPTSSITPGKDIAPPQMGQRMHLGYGGLGRERMIDVLRNIVSGTSMYPVEVLERPVGPYRYDVYHGYHRYYASIAAGFTHLPTIPGSTWVPETPALNATS